MRGICLRGARPRRVSSAFAARFAPLADLGGAPLVGVEHEYQVVLGDAGRLDFGSLIHCLDLGQPHLDPGDLNAYHLPCGVVITADDAEAEVVTPPVRVHPGFTADLVGLAGHGRRQLAIRLPSDAGLRGFSTHISVEVPDSRVGHIAQAYPSTFGAAIMLLLDDQSSPGLLVRPRPGRLELGGEFADGDRLRAALIFAVASVTAMREAAKHDLPWPVPQLAVSMDSDDHRFGWFVSRRAFGADLYDQGRETMLTTMTGQLIQANDYLQRCWDRIRTDATGTLEHDAVSLVDDIVLGRRPLPCEVTDGNGAASRRSELPLADPDEFGLDKMISRPTPLPGEASDDESGEDRIEALEPRNVFGRILEPRKRPGFDVAPVMVTWDVCVFVLADLTRARRAFACVPRDDLETFLDALDSGEVDFLIAEYLMLPPRRRLLHRHDQTVHLGLYDELGPRWRLLTREYGPNYHRWRRLLIARRVRPRDPRMLRGIIPHRTLATRRPAA
jgi:hypothetical protein